MGQPVSFQGMLDHAKALRCEADRIEQEAIASRPLPKTWNVGQMIRYITTMDHGPNRGETGFVQKVSDPDRPASEYQVLWTGPLCGKPTFWTTPNDIELIQDV